MKFEFRHAWFSSAAFQFWPLAPFGAVRARDPNDLQQLRFFIHHNNVESWFNHLCSCTSNTCLLEFYHYQYGHSIDANLWFCIRLHICRPAEANGHILSRTLQDSSMSAAEENCLAQDVIAKDRDVSSLDIFWKCSMKRKDNLNAHKPQLPRKRKQERQALGHIATYTANGCPPSKLENVP